MRRIVACLQWGGTENIEDSRDEFFLASCEACWCGRRVRLMNGISSRKWPSWVVNIGLDGELYAPVLYAMLRLKVGGGHAKMISGGKKWSL